MKFSIKNEELRDVRRFYRFFRPYRSRAVLAMVCTIIVGALGAVIPAMLKPYLDEGILSQRMGMTSGDGASAVGAEAGIAAHQPVEGPSPATEKESHWLGSWIEFDSSLFPLFIIAFALVESAFNFGANYLTTWVGRRVANDVKMELFRKLIHADPATFDKTTSGNIIVRYSGDADAASEQLLINFKNLLTRSVTSVALVAVMLYYSWILAIVAVGSLLVTVVPLTIIRRRMKKFIREQVTSGARVTTDYNEAYAGNRIITSYNLYDFTEKRLAITLKTLFRLSIKMVQRTNFLSLMMHFATAVGIAGTIWLHSILITSNRITIGDFVTCIAAMIMLYTPIKKIGSTFSTIQVCTMAIGRVLEVLDIEPTIQSRPDAQRIRTIRDAIRYNNVGFSYEPGKPVLRHIDLEIRAGQSIAFVGNSGGGKTTLVNLLPRFYDVDSGSITIDGTDLRDLDLVDLRAMIAIVFQDNFLFHGSIRENIILGKQDASEEELAHAVKAACLDEFIGTLEKGLDTQIGERGVMLSGGQKQRIAIARAFIKDAPIVILDEATSALDNKSEVVVQQAIENLMENKTVLIIAHRLSTVINADRIVVIRDGEMVESGTHADLIADSDSFYASLYKTQLV